MRLLSSSSIYGCRQGSKISKKKTTKRNHWHMKKTQVPIIWIFKKAFEKSKNRRRKKRNFLLLLLFFFFLMCICLKVCLVFTWFVCDCVCFCVPSCCYVCLRFLWLFHEYFCAHIYCWLLLRLSVCPLVTLWVRGLLQVSCAHAVLSFSFCVCTHFYILFWIFATQAYIQTHSTHTQIHFPMCICRATYAWKL